MGRTTAAVSTALLLAALLGSVVMQAWVLPTMVERVVITFPEVAPIAAPSIAWEILAIFCLQAVAVIGIRIVTLARAGRFDASAYGWLRAALAFLALFFLLIVLAWVTLVALAWATPAVMLGLFASGCIALVAIISLALFLGTRPAVRRRVSPSNSPAGIPVNES